MIAQASAGPESVSMGARTGCWSTQRPPSSASTSSTSPRAVAPATSCGRTTRMYQPITMAIGIVAPTVNVPHGLWRSAFTTTSASTAIRITMMKKTPRSAAKPPSGPISSLAICPSERPSRRRLPQRMQKSCTAPPSTTPARTPIAYAPAAATASQPSTRGAAATALCTSPPTSIPSGLADRVQPGDVAPDDEGVHVVRALVGADRLQVQHVADHGVLIHDPVGAEDVAREPRGLEGGRDVRPLGERDLLGTHRAGVLHPA